MTRKDFFVTGTGTGVGKTVVSAGLTAWLRKQGIDAVPAKPVQTGATQSPKGLSSQDLKFCLDMAGLSPSPDELAMMQPCLYRAACSPHLAGRMEGKPVKLSRLCKSVHALQDRREAVIVEGAGGILVPLDEEHTMLDLMKELRLPVVLAVSNELGALNHGLLSLEVLRRHGVDVASVILVTTKAPCETDAYIRKDNVRTLLHFAKVSHLGVLGFIEPLHRKNFIQSVIKDLGKGLKSMVTTWMENRKSS